MSWNVHIHTYIPVWIGGSLTQLPKTSRRNKQNWKEEKNNKVAIPSEVFIQVHIPCGCSPPAPPGQLQVKKTFRWNFPARSCFCGRGLFPVSRCCGPYLPPPNTGLMGLPRLCISWLLRREASGEKGPEANLGRGARKGRLVYRRPPARP